MEKSVIPCGASLQEWHYIDALGADARYIVPIVSNPDLQGIGALLRVQKTRGKIPSVKDALGRVVCLREWQTRDTTGAELPYTKQYHPMYEPLGGVPAIEEVKFSVIHNRGCFGGCSFCALAFHQGRMVQ